MGQPIRVSGIEHGYTQANLIRGGESLEDRFYNPTRLDWLLRHWGNWEALAETPSSAAGLVYPKPTPTTPRLFVRSERSHVDPHRWSDVRVDVLRAAAQLGDFSIEWYAVNAHFQGWTLAQLAESVRAWDYQMIHEAYQRALERMSDMLNGEMAEPFHQAAEHAGLRLCSLCSRPHERNSDYCSAACKQRAWRTRRTEGMVAT